MKCDVCWRSFLTKFVAMKSFLLLIPYIVLLGCSDFPKEHSSMNNIHKTLDNSNRIKHSKLFDGLKHDYVLYYRNMQAIDEEMSKWEMPNNDSVFKLDSIKYFESYRDFFKQDNDFINWLLSFKDDTTKSGLWQMSFNPYSSTISECQLWDLSNSRAAIILLENFLTGAGFECFGCKYDDRQKCSFEKYNEIETFLVANKGRSITELRAAWRRKNDR